MLLSEGTKKAHSLDDIDPIHVVGDIFHEVSDQVWIPFELFGFDLSITKLTIFMWIASSILLGVAFSVRKNLSLAPTGRLANAVEALVMFVRDDIVKPNLHDDWKRFMPLFATFFFFVLINNSIGMIPYFANPTGNISVTIMLATMTFLTIIFASVKKNGIGGFLKSFVPPDVPTFILPIIVLAEVLGLFTKSFALCIRLFANMIAGHIVILTLFGLIYILHSWILVPFTIVTNIGISILEILIVLIQTYVFTYLSAIFVGMSLNPEH